MIRVFEISDEKISKPTGTEELIDRLIMQSLPQKPRKGFVVMSKVDKMINIVLDNLIELANPLYLDNVSEEELDATITFLDTVTGAITEFSKYHPVPPRK